MTQCSTAGTWARVNRMPNKPLCWPIGRTVPAAIFVSLVGLAGRADAQTPNLASAETFGVLAGSAVTNVGATAVDGDVGVGPGGTISGAAIAVDEDSSIHEGDAVSAQALLDASETFDALSVSVWVLDDDKRRLVRAASTAGVPTDGPGDVTTTTTANASGRM